MSIQLVVKDGTLYYPDSVIDWSGEPGPIVLCVYPEGDCDTIQWPNPNLKNLAAALFDDREMGQFEDGEEIQLPNGDKVDF